MNDNTLFSKRDHHFLCTKKAPNIEKLEMEECIKKDLENNCHDAYILRLDIDNLRGINATCGNSHGDSLIDYTYRCIANVLDKQQKVYCLSGGEFIIISPNKNSCSSKELYKKIQQEITELMIQNDYLFSFSISGGVVMLDNATIDVEELLKRSEFTLESAKKKGHNQYYCFNQKEYDEKLNHHHLILRLQKAVNNDFDGFAVHFQPIANREGKIKAAEALLRFKTDEVTIHPSLLITLLEETGLIIPVGRWTLKKALEFCKQVRMVDKDFVVSVNMSYIEATDYTRLDYILTTLKACGVPARNLGIELTESGLLETDKNIQRLWQGLKKAGVYISLDDFGTGFSNFQYIENIKPNLLKVDYRITQKAMLCERHFMILEAISSVVKHLDLKLCIEGIENEAIFEKMKQLDATLYQGYHFSKPCPSDEFINKFFTMKERGRKAMSHKQLTKELTVTELRNTITALKQIFDIVRVVDATLMTQYELSDNDELIPGEYQCYAVWEKDHRCENCISAKSLATKKTTSKFEFIHRDVYFVMSHFILYKGEEYVIELVKEIHDDVLFDAYGKEGFVEIMNQFNDKIYKDELTGAYNRRYFNEQHLKIARDAAVVMIDIDQFKSLNDTYGHKAGDLALQALASCIQSNIRGTDRLIRMGGDEFILILENIPIHILEEKLMHIKEEVSYIQFEEYPMLHMTISIGAVATSSNVRDSLVLADKMLYLAKEERNMVKIYEKYQNDKN